MRILVGPLIALLLAGCAIAPEGTSLDRIGKTLHHVDHPEYVSRPKAPTFTGAEPMMVLSDAAKAAWKTDAEACGKAADETPRDPRQSLSEFSQQYREQLWGCLLGERLALERDSPRTVAP